MNQAVVFDTHRFVERLTENGFSKQQAEVLADEQVNLLNGNPATKTDLSQVEAGLKANLARVEARLKANLARVEARLKANLARVEAGLKANLARVEAGLAAKIAQVEAGLKVEIEAAKVGLIKWVTGMILAIASIQTAVLVAAMRFM